MANRDNESGSVAVRKGVDAGGKAGGDARNGGLGGDHGGLGSDEGRLAGDNAQGVGLAEESREVVAVGIGGGSGLEESCVSGDVACCCSRCGLTDGADESVLWAKTEEVKIREEVIKIAESILAVLKKGSN